MSVLSNDDSTRYMYQITRHIREIGGKCGTSSHGISRHRTNRSRPQCGVVAIYLCYLRFLLFRMRPNPILAAAISQSADYSPMSIPEVTMSITEEVQRRRGSQPLIESTLFPRFR